EVVRVPALYGAQDRAQPRCRTEQAAERGHGFFPGPRDDHAIAAPAAVDLEHRWQTKARETGVEIHLARDRNRLGRPDADLRSGLHRCGARHHAVEILERAERTA